MHQNIMYSQKLKLFAYKTIEGAEKIMDLDDMVAYAASTNDANLHRYVDTILKLEMQEAVAELEGDEGKNVNVSSPVDCEVDDEDALTMARQVKLEDDEEIYILEVKKSYRFKKQKIDDAGGYND